MISAHLSMRRGTAWRTGALVGGAIVLALAAWAQTAPSRSPLDVVATGVPRPLQLAFDGRGLLILSPGTRGDAAGEIYRVDLGGELPVDLSGRPRIRIPFVDSRMAVLGSLVLHPGTRELFLGEENGARIYRVTEDERVTLYAGGLYRLGGGSTLAFDRRGRMVIVDYAYWSGQRERDDRPPPGLEQLWREDYFGPLVFRITLDPEIPLPRRLDRLAPLFPRAWGGGPGRGLRLPLLTGVAPLGEDDLVFLTSAGELFRLTADGNFALYSRLPPGQYHRINMVTAPDGTLYVSGGFWVAQVFRVSRDGAVTVVASRLADPQGIALDAQGNLYIAESSFHRIIRLRPL